MSHFIHAPGPVACRRPPSEPVVVVPGARICPRVPRLPVTSVDGRPPDRTGDVALEGVARIVPGAVAGNIASLTEGGNPADSGISSDEVRRAVAEAATAYQKPEDGVPKTDLSEAVQASLDNADTAVQPNDIAGFVDGAEYDAEYGDPPKPAILLKHGSEVVATVDAADFVIDGMVSNVEVKNGNLVITFNTDSGKQPISIPLTDIFDPANYYTKTETNALLADKLDKGDVVAPSTSADAGKAASAKATGDQLALKASKSDATLTERAGFSEWNIAYAQLTPEWKAGLYEENPSAAEDDYAVRIVDDYVYVGGYACVLLTFSDDGLTAYYRTSSSAATFFGPEPGTVVATRTSTVLPGYQLGDQELKPLASEAEAEALRVGKQDALTFDNAPTSGSNNPVKSGGIWSALWGALAVLPTGFSSLYDWCVEQLAGKASKSDATLTKRGYTDWSLDGTEDQTYAQGPITLEFVEGGWQPTENVLASSVNKGNDSSLRLEWSASEWGLDGEPESQSLVATRDTVDSEWVFSPATTIHGGVLSMWRYAPTPLEVSWEPVVKIGYGDIKGDSDSASLVWHGGEYVEEHGGEYEWGGWHDLVATRTALQGYQLGSQSDKPLASEAEAEALRNDKLDKSGGTMTGTLTVPIAEGLRFGDQFHTAAVQDVQRNKYLMLNDGTNSIAIPIKNGTAALAAPNPTAGNLAALDANGNPTDAGCTAGDLARYALTTKTISNGAVTLDDRAINAVAVSSALASLTVNFPTATSGKARDFGLRLTVASGITTAPQIVLPQGVTCENADGEAPEIGADGAATILYFTEMASGVFLVKGEVLTAITA